MALACVSTAKGAAAIAVVEVFGDGAVDIVGAIFRADSGRQCAFDTGTIYTGSIIDGGEIIDHVVAARVEENNIEINCHGNPLIVEMVMSAFGKAGAELVDAERLIAEKLNAGGTSNSIEIEAEIEKLKSLSLAGVKAVCESDLSAVANEWIKRIDSLNIEDVKGKCKDILAASKPVKYLISGCRAVIAGPPNSGKSTLLNTLCGRQKAIVTDIAGTTRDWVCGTCKAGELTVEFFDTAGLDDSIIGDSTIDAESQKRSRQLLDHCDIVLLVLDSTQATGDFNFDIIAESGKKVIKVYNKSDIGKTPAKDGSINISAMTGDGIEKLLELVKNILVGNGNIAKTICFTERQTAILKRIIECDDIKIAETLLTELLNGNIQQGQPLAGS